MVVSVDIGGIYPLVLFKIDLRIQSVCTYVLSTQHWLVFKITVSKGVL